MKRTAIVFLFLLFTTPAALSQDSMGGGLFGPPDRIRRSTFANLSTPLDGHVRYCTNCSVTAPCTGGGSGAFAFRSGSVWNCQDGGGSFSGVSSISGDPLTAPSFTSATGDTASGTLAADTYYYVITAVDHNGYESPISVERSATIAAPGKVTLAWSSYSGALGFNVYRGTTTGVYTDVYTGLAVAGSASSTGVIDEGSISFGAAGAVPGAPGGLVWSVNFLNDGGFQANYFIGGQGYFTGVGGNTSLIVVPTPGQRGSDLGGQTVFDDGTATEPSLAFKSDDDATGTGIFRSAANAIGFTTNGVERWVMNASGAFNCTVDGGCDIGNGSADPRDLSLKRNLILRGSTSGTTTVSAPAIAGTTVVTMPSATTTLVGIDTIGTWVPVAYNAGNFTASAGLWVVDAGDQTTFSYTLTNKRMEVQLWVLATDVDTNPATLRLTIPAAATAASTMHGTCSVVDAGAATEVGRIFSTAASTVLTIRRAADAAWTTTAADNTAARCYISFEVQ